MQNDRITDPTFGINHQAMSVLTFLAGKEPAFAEYSKKYNRYIIEIQTRPWYNGRESGFVISMKKDIIGSKRALHISVFEHRNSNAICALEWETESFYWNHPLEDKDIFDKAYKGQTKWDLAHTVDYGEIGKMVDWVYNEMEKFYISVSLEETKTKGGE